ncbi:uncharacterized protein N7529_003453 [Penicillium soppii]|uniref:uncharacterized protein n=1 Tax=Penicillium soppii TaxID=69789 RepID=UPI0025495254|nr:uncharacterized protein N7529_003453 [Penicillium soppii]KAJ5871100.1 hypothetical protein N7529_003453 [Penicillium soppii]
MLPQQIFLLGKLTTWPTTLSLEAEWTRRNEAVEAVRMYCDVREGGPRRGRRRARQPPSTTNDMAVKDISNSDPTSDQTLSLPSEEDMREAEIHIRTAIKPLGCFQCHGNSDEPDERRMKHYSRHNHLLRHFRATHLDDRHCNYCNNAIEHEMELRRHAHDKHRLKT